MAPIVTTVDITRPAGEVFSYVTDPARFDEWQEGVVNVRLKDAAGSQVGSTFTTTRRIGPIERTMTQEVIENKPPVTWTAQGIDGPVRPWARVIVEPLSDPARSRVVIELDFEAHGIGMLLVPLVVRRMAAKAAPTSSQNLKRRLETDG
jgi:uncharacterized protein YndB with AHSA1/START domain